MVSARAVPSACGSQQSCASRCVAPPCPRLPCQTGASHVATRRSTRRLRTLDPGPWTLPGGPGPWTLLGPVLVLVHRVSEWWVAVRPQSEMLTMRANVGATARSRQIAGVSARSGQIAGRLGQIAGVSARSGQIGQSSGEVVHACGGQMCAAEWSVGGGARWGGESEAQHVRALLYVSIIVACRLLHGQVPQGVHGHQVCMVEASPRASRVPHQGAHEHVAPCRLERCVRGLQPMGWGEGARWTRLRRGRKREGSRWQCARWQPALGGTLAGRRPLAEVACMVASWLCACICACACACLEGGPWMACALWAVLYGVLAAPALAVRSMSICRRSVAGTHDAGI